MKNRNDTLLKTAHADKIPLWIKVMWFLGVLWVIGYIVKGLINGPQL